MSKSASTASLFPSWKEEVNRRVAAHMSQKGHPAAQSLQPADDKPTPGSRAAQAAARVAARYASAPSFSEMLAREALAAARAAEAASRAAQHAHAAAQYVLAGLEAASSANPEWDAHSAPESVPEPQTEAAFLPLEAPGPVLIQNEPSTSDSGVLERRARPAKSATGKAKSRRSRPSALPALSQNRYEPPSPAAIVDNPDDASGDEVAQPIFANLIQFPREVVATRKMRPRRAEGPLANTAPEAQLSIFEVDPGSISMQPALAAADESAAPAWMRADWAGIELEEQPQQNIVEEPALPASLPAIAKPASLSRRLLALMVDSGLIAATCVGVVALVVNYAKVLPSVRTLELVTIFSLLVLSAAYQTLFFTLTSFTPGMWYAGICLRTIEGEIPSRRQRCARLMALPLSIIPLGLGLLWSLFDDSQLTWHDRLSSTCLRRV